MAFSQVSVFLPLRRYECCPWQRPVGNMYGGYRRNASGNLILVPVFDSSPSTWNSFNQNWTVRLTPATLGTMPGDASDLSLATILGTPPPQSLVSDFTPPPLSSVPPGEH